MAHQETLAGGQVSEDMPERDMTLRKFHKWSRASQLAFAAFVALGTITLIWLIPWLPIGMDTHSYSPEVAFSIILLGSFAVTGILVWFFRKSAQRQLERLKAWTELSRTLDDHIGSGLTSGENESSPISQLHQ